MVDNAGELLELLSHFVGSNFSFISVGSTGNGYCTTCTCLYFEMSNFTDLIFLSPSLSNHLDIKKVIAWTDNSNSNFYKYFSRQLKIQYLFNSFIYLPI